MRDSATEGILSYLPGGDDLQSLATAALEASYDSVLITDDNLDHPTIVYVNPAFCQMTGWQRHASESGHPLSIILLDIDHFKQINDEHGHSMGDLVLERIGRLINQRLNRQDIGIRWGGEEFLLVLLDTDLHGARLAAEAFRELIAETRFHDEIRVTASFGAAQRRPEENLNALFNRADAALYETKEHGRNQVRIAEN